LKILVVDLSVYPIFTGFVSGGDRHKLEICKRFRSYGYESAMLTTETGAEILKQNDICVKTYTVSAPFEKILCRSVTGLILVYITRMIKVIPLIFKLHEHFSMICTFSHFLVNVLPAVAVSRRNFGSKLVVYIHHLEPKPLKRSEHHELLPSVFGWLSQSFSLLLIKVYADIVFVNMLDEDSITKLGISEEKVKVMYQGLELEKIAQAKSGKKEYDACFLGRLAPFKGIFDLVDVWENVCRVFPQARLAVIGSELKGYVDQLKRRIKVAGLEENILLLGVLPEDLKYAILKACKIFVFPSYEEGWGIAVCEALACGLPVVAYDLPAYKIFRDAIITVPVGDKDAFSEAVLELLLNETLRMEIGKKAEIAARQFDWNKIAEEELQIIQHLQKGEL